MKICQRFLAEFRPPDAVKEATKLAPAAPGEDAQKAVLVKMSAAQADFKKKLEDDIVAIGYPYAVSRRDGSRFEGTVHRISLSGIVITTPYGEVTLRMTELSPATLLAMSGYFTQRDTNPASAVQRNWLAGVTAVSMGLKNEGKALMEKAAAQRPDLQGEMKAILAN